MALSTGLVLALILTFTGRSSSTLAASRTDHEAFDGLLAGVEAPFYQNGGFVCTLAVTTTDALEEAGIPNDNPQNAAPLSDYTGLALATGFPGEQVPAEEDWFELNNAEVGASYGVEALPDETTNYNLGIIVYDSNLTPIITETNSVDNNRAEVVLRPDDQGPYYFKVHQLAPGCRGGTYHLDTSFTPATPTPSVTPPPTADEDAYEPNNNFAEAMAEGPTLPIQVPILLELTFHVEDDADFFRFYAKGGRWYQATTSDLNLVDTLVEIYDRNQTRVARDDDGAGGLASRASWRAEYDGYYFIVIQNNVDSVGGYNLTVDEISEPATVTPGPSPTPGATPRASADDCESNPDFEHACVIPVNESQTFNFIPAFGGGPDNDFYKVWVKPGLHFRCQTSDLAPGVDPNMIVFSGPSWDQAIGGNDDIAPCDFNSAFNYYATYSGWLYVLIGTGNRTPPDVFNSDYTLLCEKSTTAFSATSTPRPTATPDSSGKLPTAVPTATPTTTESPVATPTPGSPALSIRPLTTPMPPPTPAPRFVPISLLVYYDSNNDGQAGAGEGIAGISAQAYAVATNELLAQGYTDAQGKLPFTVSAQGPVRLTIPFLGFSHMITYDAATQEEASVQVRVPPHSPPGGTP
jgi:hypothetical protein